MNNPAIEQALIELEESLKQIKSANENVNSVSQKSEQLIFNMNKVIEALNAISSNINIDKKAINDQLSENSKTLKDGITEVLKDANDKYSQIESQLDKNKQKFEIVLDGIAKSTESKLTIALNEYVESFKLSVTLINNEIKYFNEKVSSAKDNIGRFESSLNELESRITQTDFKTEFRLLDKKFTKKNNLLLIINITILIGILAIIFIK